MSEKQSIGIFTAKVPGVDPWDPDSIQSGITGSEEAVVYISQELARLGYKVVVFGDPPPGSVYSAPSANPRFVDARCHSGSRFDIAISWRMATIAEELKKWADKVYFWPHDVCVEHLTQRQIDGFDDVLWLSQWQKEHWASINPGFRKFSNVFGNGILLSQFGPVQERSNPFSCIYGSNYSRGLEILLEIWPDIKKQFPRAGLEIYYGWQTYGLLSKEKEAQMRRAVNRLSSLDVKEMGRVGHEELNQAYARASFWTYPCIQAEVFCITALRAQFAGAVPVVVEGAALSETVLHGYRCSRPDHYFRTLANAMQDAEKIPLQQRKKMRDFITEEYSWEVIAKKWNLLFENLSRRTQFLNA